MSTKQPGSGLAIGIAPGTALGAVTNNISLWLQIKIAHRNSLGIALSGRPADPPPAG